MTRIVSKSIRLYVLPLTTLVLFVAGAFGESVSPISNKKMLQLKTRAELGYVRQEIELANAYFTGNGVPQDTAQAAHWYERAAQAGNAEAQNQIGYFYQSGIGVPVDLERAARWFQLAAASGLPKGKVNLGVAYLGGLGVPKNEATAIQLFTEAFQKGSGVAAAYLGDIYFSGVGVPQDRVLAENWYESGFKLHDPLAAYKLGILYSSTEDHIHDFRKAVGFLRESVDRGYVPAMHSLGFMLVNYPALAKSPNEAEPLLEAAASGGIWQSSLVLGILARDGKGVPVDNKAAYYHFLVAARQGGPEAQRMVVNDLKHLQEKLGADDQAQLTSAADAWSAQHSMPLLYITKATGNHSHIPAMAITRAPEGTFVGQLLVTSESGFRQP
jgi:TPR repeat protein